MFSVSNEKTKPKHALWGCRSKDSELLTNTDTICDYHLNYDMEVTNIMVFCSTNKGWFTDIY